jgi:glyoxylase-like metal-dependent hydrolase (beta-lactamase superfamily II)
MKPVAADWFQHERLAPDLIRITEMHFDPIARANLWLLTGRDRHLLIDTGLGVSDLARYLSNTLASLLDKPLTVVCTHMHFDHAGGLADFKNTCLHCHEVDLMKRGDATAALALPEQGFNADDYFDALPYPGFSAASYRFRPCVVQRALNDGDVIDLGDRSLEVLHLPGHSPGSIALYDPAQDTLYSGDVVYDGELIDQAHGCVPEAYSRSMERLARLAPRLVHPGHYHSFDNERMQRLIEGYLAGRREPGCPTLK